MAQMSLSATLTAQPGQQNLQNAQAPARRRLRLEISVDEVQDL